MTAYSRSRVAIGTFTNPDALCRCLGSLEGTSGLAAPLYVVAPSPGTRDEWQKRSCVDGAENIRPGIEYLAADGAVELTDDSSADLLVASFEHWMEHKSAAFLQDRLADGAVLLFIPVNNDREQAAVFQALRGNATGRVVLHDMPSARH